MFEIRNLTFKNILNIPALRIATQTACIVGPSGSGKSTLLRMLNRLLAPDTGTVLYNGSDISALDAVALRRRVVMLGQTPVVYPGDIRDNLQIGLSFSGRGPAADEELRAVLARVGLEKGLDEGCATLSGGERQRLCLARVMLMGAECYLLDEPSSALDRETERFVVDNLAQFAAERDRQLVMVTHSEAVAQAYPQGLIRLENGQVREEKE